MTLSIFRKKVLFERASSYSDDFMGSINTLRNQAKNNNKVGMPLEEINKIIKSTRKKNIL